MVKKFIGLTIAVLLLFSLAACNPPEEDGVSIPFELSGKTTNYFDTEERESLLKKVNSLEELTQLLSEKEFTVSPMYEGTFFEEHALVLHGFTHPANWQYSIEKVTIDGVKLIMHKTLNAPKEASGALIAVGVTGSTFFCVEVNKADVVDTEALEIKTTII